MTVHELRHLLRNLAKALEPFDNWTLRSLLRALEAEQSESLRSVSKLKPGHSASRWKALGRRLAPLESQDEIAARLSLLTRPELLDFARTIGLRPDKKQSKADIARSAASHLNLPKLNQRISERADNNAIGTRGGSDR